VDDDDGHGAHPGAPISGKSCPTDANDTDNGGGKEDAQGGAK
jgi:hypothetical protein